MTAREQEIAKLKEQDDSLTRRIQQLEKQLEVEKGRFATREAETNKKLPEQ